MEAAAAGKGGDLDTLHVEESCHRLQTQGPHPDMGGILGPMRLHRLVGDKGSPGKNVGQHHRPPSPRLVMTSLLHRTRLATRPEFNLPASRGGAWKAPFATSLQTP